MPFPGRYVVEHIEVVAWKVAYHPYFLEWFEESVNVDVEVAGEIQALIDAVASHGRDLGDPESHPVVTSRLGLRALRRTPPTSVTFSADGPPVIRVLYGFVAPARGELRAVLLLGGDKTDLGNRWYPTNLAEAERRLTVFAAQQGWRIVR
jgi:hypothetical protein